MCAMLLRGDMPGKGVEAEGVEGAEGLAVQPCGAVGVTRHRLRATARWAGVAALLLHCVSILTLSRAFVF